MVAKLKIVEPHDLDVCACGDPRRDHKDGVGPCIHNKPQDITHGYKDCMKFQFSRPHIKGAQRKAPGHLSATGRAGKIGGTAVLDRDDVVERLELAKKNISRMAWALGLHVKDTYTVEREAENINGWIDQAIEVLTDSARMMKSD